MTGATGIRVELLGRVEVVRGGARAERLLAQPKRVALLACLLSLDRLFQRSRRLPGTLRYALTVALVLAGCATSSAFRAGDVRHSQADIGKAKRLLGYAPTHDVRQGLEAALPYYIAKARSDTGTAAL